MFSKFQRAFTKLLLNKTFASVAISVGVFAFVSAASQLPPSINPFSAFFANADLGIRNVLLQRYAETNPHPAIAIVEIDDKTLSDKGGLGRWQDFRRDYYAKVIDKLKESGAVVVGLDVLFSEKSASGDEALAESMSRAGNVVLGFAAGGKALDKGAVVSIAPIFPIAPLLSEAASLGFFNPNLHPGNSVVYSVAPAKEIDGKTYESFSLTVLRKYLDLVYGKKTSASSENLGYEDYYAFHEGDYQFLPHAGGYEGGALLINYLSNGATFPRLSFVDVYEGNFKAEDVKDRIVLV